MKLESLKSSKFEAKKVSLEMLKMVQGGKDVNTTSGDISDTASHSRTGQEKLYDRTTTWRDSDGLHIDVSNQKTIHDGAQESWYN